MQVIENWADVRGRVLAVGPHPQLNGFVCVTLEVLDVKAVPGFANLFEPAKGQRIDVSLPVAASLWQAGRVVGEVNWRLRKAGPSSNFIHPDSIGA